MRLAIFDLDGTLIDSLNDITAALNCALLPLSLPTLAPARVAGMIGEGALKLVQQALETYHLNLDPGPIVRRYTDSYSSHLTELTTLYPAAKETLESLKFLRLAIVSNKSEALSRAILDSFRLLEYFDILVCADTIPERKPSPAPLFHALSSLGVPPESVVMVGDSEVDVTAGKAARVRTVAVTHGYGKPGFEKEADFVIPNLLPLPALIRSMDL